VEYTTQAGWYALVLRSAPCPEYPRIKPSPGSQLLQFGLEKARKAGSLGEKPGGLLDSKRKTAQISLFPFLI
jgi:hypothetical protein